MCAAEERINPLTEHFSFSVITWKIENISIALCPSTQTLYSEDFLSSGREDIDWKMSLKISHEKNTVGLYLKMLGPDEKFFCIKDREPGLKVKCYANILDSNGEQPLKSERTFYFEYREDKEIETFSLTDILTNLPHIGPDDLTIRCHILVDYGQINVVPVDVPLGVIELSKTLEKLIKDPIYPDIKILVNNSMFLINRDMLLNVEGLGGDKLDERFAEIQLLNHCEYSIHSILMYAYSGNINYILDTPRIRVAEDIERLRVNELFAAYPKTEIYTRSTIEVKKGFFNWAIGNFDKAEKPEEKSWNVEKGNTSWRFCMYPEGRINGNVQEKKHVYFEATLLQSIRPFIDVNIELCCFGKNKTKYSRRNHQRMKVGDKLEIPFFRRGGLLMRKFLIDGRLSLRTKLSIATGRIGYHIEPIVRPLPFLLTSSICMIFFSRKMGISLRTPKHWDLCLTCMNTEFHVHKFVVASRSPYFKNRVKNIYRQTHDLPQYRKHYMRVFLEYLYTGLCCDFDDDSTYHMYEFGLLFQMRLLMDRFREEIDLSNILKYLLYAIDNRLQNAFNECMQFVTSIGSQIQNHPHWERFRNEKPNYADTIMSHWR